VITADLLRFLTLTAAHERDATLARPAGVPLHFFTMGSPLRQLYGLRFPHLYQWARHATDCPSGHDCSILDDALEPAPNALDVATWTNAYRSGDYVGRSLWRRDGCAARYATPTFELPQPWSAGPFPVSASASPATPPILREFCVGAGGHTRYWHHTAPQIGLELDALIQR
jgi:hypothetical protein